MKDAGYIIIDGKEVATSRQCCHCGAHWIPKPGSGTIRGFCMKCSAHTCGAPTCNPCYPIEKRLEDMAKYPILYGVVDGNE